MPRLPRSFAIRSSCAALLCGWLCASSPAQTTTDTIYHLHGTVRNGITNKPIGRALVTSADRRLATMTDAEGHFNIDLSVPPKADNASPAQAAPVFITRGLRFGGGLSFTAQRPGYLAAEQQTPVTIDDSLNTTDFSLKLMPAASISGRVSAAGVESLRGVHVTLLHRQVMDGALSWLPNGSQNVTGTGEFRFSNLQPGEYTVMTSEWAGGEPVAVQRTAVTRQYPPDFLGDAPNLTASAKLRLHYGDEQTAELHLHAATYYPVAVPVQNQPANSPINVRLAGTDTFNGFQLGWNARDGAVEGALPNGNYTLLLTSFGPQQGSSAVPLTVANQPLEHAPVTLAAGSRIPIHVRTEFTQTDPPSNMAGPDAGFAANRANLVQLYLRPVDSGGAFGGSSVRHGDDTESALENVQPGVYIVHTNASRGYVSSMTSGSIDLLRHPFTIGDGGSADPIEITLRDDGATLTGTVDYVSSTPQSGSASLLLVSNDSFANAVQGYAAQDGKFTMRNIPPGSYRLFAMTGARMLQLPYRDAQAMRAYAGKGTPVTVTAGQSATANATVIDVADMDRE